MPCCEPLSSLIATFLIPITSSCLQKPSLDRCKKRPNEKDETFFEFWVDVFYFLVRGIKGGSNETNCFRTKHVWVLSIFVWKKMVVVVVVVVVLLVVVFIIVLPRVSFRKNIVHISSSHFLKKLGGSSKASKARCMLATCSLRMPCFIYIMCGLLFCDVSSSSTWIVIVLCCHYISKVIQRWSLLPMNKQLECSNATAG